jgi:phosphoserine phosphatase
MKTVLAAWSALVVFTAASGQADPLPSWNDTETRQAIVSFVERVTREGSADYVEPSARIAVFDNDGTLWAEKPAYFQLFFIVDRIKALAPEHPAWETQEPYASLLKGDLKAVLAGGEKAIAELAMATHAGMTTDAFTAIVNDWMENARHPVTGKRYGAMVYQPMLEVLDYLRAHGFKTFIVSGGGIDFMRPWTERVYGIPPEQVVGSRIKTRYEVHNGQPVIARLPAIDFVDDKEGKPAGIQQHIGRRPLMAFGNSDGDFQMLEYTTAGDGARLGILIHHTDGEREWAYDRESHTGKLDRGLDEASGRGWIVVDMKNDWSTIYPE